MICEIEMKSETVDELFEFVSVLGYNFYLFQDNYLIRIQKEDLINFNGAPNFLLVHESINFNVNGNLAKI